MENSETANPASTQILKGMFENAVIAVIPSRPRDEKLKLLLPDFLFSVCTINGIDLNHTQLNSPFMKRFFSGMEFMALITFLSRIR